MITACNTDDTDTERQGMLQACSLGSPPTRPHPHPTPPPHPGAPPPPTHPPTHTSVAGPPCILMTSAASTHQKDPCCTAEHSRQPQAYSPR